VNRDTPYLKGPLAVQGKEPTPQSDMPCITGNQSGDYEKSDC
jgi:hypothetical protein